DRPRPKQARPDTSTDSDEDNDSDKPEGPAQHTRAKTKQRETRLTPERLIEQTESEGTQTTIEQTQTQNLPDNQSGAQSDTLVGGPECPEDQPCAATSEEVTVTLPDEILDYNPGPAYTLSPYSTIDAALAQELFPDLQALVE
ncbi:MAG: hypothetical protein ACRC6N_04605, partial [Plesiomonas sp.]|uniref:hypothetical protein n=1 Tax=Plesiomonas sp. TaxID=2486279 RepID=UPI003F40CE18